MQIRIKEPCVVGGYTNVNVGDILEVLPHIGQILIGMGRAIEVNEVQTREPVIENRDPAPAPKRVKGKLP
jgi:hypothetical protein